MEITMAPRQRASSLQTSQMNGINHLDAVNTNGLVKGQKTTMAYWQDYLDGVEQCLFPTHSSDGLDDDSPMKSIKVRLDRGLEFVAFCERENIAPVAAVQLAWAIVLKCYTGNEDVCFGFVTEDMDLLVSRVDLAERPVVRDALRALQERLARSVCNRLDGPFGEVYGLGSNECPLFNTLVTSHRAFGEILPQLETKWQMKFDLILHVSVDRSGVDVCLMYRAPKVPARMARSVAGSFSRVLLEKATHLEQPVSALPVVSSSDYDQLLQWNDSLVGPFDTTIHDAIYEVCCRQPDRPAVYSWDGQLTYRELWDRSSQLCQYLRSRGIGSEMPVPICMDKSPLAIISILAVLMAGGSCVMIDPGTAIQRVRGIMQENPPLLILLSASAAHLDFHSAAEKIVVSPETFPGLVAVNSCPPAAVKPSDIAFIYYTSGSTGRPKGILAQHNGIYTGVQVYGRCTNITKETRLLQFASYLWSMSMVESLTTLVHGGCLCLPSQDTMMNDLRRFTAKAQVTMCSFTPSVLRLFEPKDFPGVQTISLIGEPLTQDVVDSWASHVNLINAYGPTEGGPIASYVAVQAGQWKTGDVGKAIPGALWIVNPSNPNQPLPIGAVGELLIQGPTVARGYLKRPDATQAAFIPRPSWLPAATPEEQQHRFYLSGDLARHNPDGSLQFIGRKDRQVKIRGQRIELEEVEAHVRGVLSSTKDVVVEAVQPTEEPNSKMLVAFVAPRAAGIEDAVLIPADDEFICSVETLRSRLHDTIPRYMMPPVFLQISHIPRNKSGKVDRRRLQQMVQGHSREHMDALIGPRRDTTEPATQNEALVQAVWAECLRVSPADIGRHDNFFALGGDSLAAMKVVSRMHDRGFNVTFAEVFNRPTLSMLAENLQKDDHAVQHYQRFSLIPAGDDIEAVRSQAEQDCSVDSSEIEDIYPCTALQTGLLSLTMRAQGLYVGQYAWRLREADQVQRLMAAWQTVVDHNPILRTRIIQSGSDEMLQVVMSPAEVDWVEASCLEEYLAGQRQREVSPGRPLAQFAIIREEGSVYFAATLHHALYDGFTLSLLFRDLEAAYNGQPLSPRPFSPFIAFISRSDSKAIADFWTQEFHGLSCSPFPPLPSDNYFPSVTERVDHCVDIPQSASQYTISTVLRLAWATVISTYTDSDDVVFGVTGFGRDAPVSNIAQMTGPTIATVPFRVQTNPEQTTQDALESIQTKGSRLVDVQQTGLHKIRTLSPETALACQFQSLLVVQPSKSERPDLSSILEDVMDRDSTSAADNSYAINIVCHPTPDTIAFHAAFDPKVVTPAAMQSIMCQFGHVTSRILDGCEFSGDLRAISPQGMGQLREWNGHLPEPMDACAQDVILSHSQSTPDALAVDAWDGQLSFHELDDLSLGMAGHLIAHGVRPGAFVPLLFEKAKYTPVAMLAVMRAAGVFVPLDSSQPTARLQSLCQQIGAPLVVASDECASLASELLPHTLTVSMPHLKTWAASPPPVLPVCRPEDPLYCIFTSGSTGQPKGAINSHSAYCTMAKDLGERTRMTASTRHFQFASYAFDVSVADHLTPLMHGACVCIPSKDEVRNSLAAAIQQYQPTSLELTPSVSRILDTHDLSSVQTLNLSGEGMVRRDVDRWHDKLQLVNSYGPAECAYTATLQASIGAATDPNNIGYPTGCVCWVTDPIDHNRLLPIGAIGELVIEGPIVGVGYLNNPDKTAAAFVEELPWLRDFRGKTHVRAYKTGDLVQQHPDGSLQYIGRKDMQVKVRGQRIELGEVEHHALQAFELEAPSYCRGVAGEVIRFATNNSLQSALMIFVEVATAEPALLHKPEDKIALLPPSASFQTLTQRIQDRLRDMVPTYMIPSIILPITRIPLSKSGKVDRKALQAIAKSLDRADLDPYLATRAEKRMPETEMQKQLQAIAGEVLRIPLEQIGLNDSFLSIGGDSIGAMAFVGRCRGRNIVLSVQQLFGRATMEQLALLAESSCR
ncbi:hypothetical protein ASPWEDRAFT_185690 [Aspergillus wentii DTO 134E9]|uniref:Carrier domain-containing protein n=1 Tax=Aspergillus wentii DTO 134E9 TaxID=1073089 RepID=A0A1L9RED4_ASPWE|nr:uncharacterized protein ASPWEDRAFT_185690 [Aspergillus wentii DTO 134E9]OJJ33281.1 hypothetical protein ASPWEDRAFT_185690 [Aspergillus wentii DTO 134E9]